MARTVHVRVVPVRRLVLDMRRRDRDPARLLLRRLVNLVERREFRAPRLRQDLRDRRRQRRLAVVNVANRSHVAVRLRSLEFRLSHLCLALVLDWLVFSGDLVLVLSRLAWSG